jgi:DNA-binding beta-propeller fold protein YncE
LVTDGGSTTLSTDTVTPIDLATGTAGSPIRVGTGPVPVAMDGTGRWAVVGNTGVARSVGSTVTFVDLHEQSPGWTVSVHGLPGAVAIVGQTAT